MNTGNANNTPGGAAIEASHYNAGDPGPGGTGSGGSIDLDCGWSFGIAGATGSGIGENLSQSQLEDILASAPDDSFEIRYQCYLPNGEPFDNEYYLTGDDADSLGADFPPDPADLIDPFALAEQAVNEITLPIPHIETSPPVEAGTYAQLETYLAIANWDQTPSATATAGPVVVEVTATPVGQTWTIYDRYRGGEETISCEGPGSTEEGSDCTWEPEHSSDGQPNGNEWQAEATGEACFYAEVTVEWEMTWTVGGEPGEPALDPGVASGSTCLVVAEVQAIVEAD